MSEEEQKKLERKEWFAKRDEALMWLKQEFPECFGKNELLKVGIWQDIESYEGDGKPEQLFLKHAVVKYAGDLQYVYRIRKGASRFDLHGKQVGEVSETEAEQAKQKFKSRQNKIARKKKVAKKEAELQKQKDGKGKSETKKSDAMGRPVLSLRKKRDSAA